jgi:VanZ family protein
VSGLRPLPHLALWRWLGRLALAATVVVCLIPLPKSPIHVEGGDKLEHALGWLLITLWYAQLTVTHRALLARACGFVALGAAIELAQSLTGWRSADPADLVANFVGVATGVALGLTPLRAVLARWDRRTGP